MITDNLTSLVTVSQSGGMKIGDWITLGAVLVALGLGLASLVQTQKSQKRERLERLLNEIIEWAIGVSTGGFNTDLANWRELLGIGVEESDIDKAKGKLKVVSKVISLESLSKFLIASAKTEFFTGISSGFPELNKAIRALAVDLNNHIKLLQQDVLDQTPSQDIGAHRQRLSEVGKIVIQEAAKLKISGVGYKEVVMPKEDNATEYNEPTLKDIGERLTQLTATVNSINGRQIKNSWQWPSGFGVTAVIIGYNFFREATTIDIKVASLIIIILGFLFFILAFRPLKKS